MTDPNRGRGEQHLDDRRPLAYVYDGEILLAVLYDRRMAESFLGSEDAVRDSFGVVSLTPWGEEVLGESEDDTE